MADYLRRFASDSFVGLLSGLTAGIFSAVVLTAFSDELRDWSIRLKTSAPPGYVLLVYDPRAEDMVEPVITYNVYGIRNNDDFEGFFGLRNGDQTTNFDLSFRFKGFSRDGEVYFSYQPSHAERFGSGQFQSINRLSGDTYYGILLAHVCDSGGSSSTSVQRALIGVLGRPNVELPRLADKAVENLLHPPNKDPVLKEFFELNFSSRSCLGESPVSEASSDGPL